LVYCGRPLQQGLHGLAQLGFPLFEMAIRSRLVLGSIGRKLSPVQRHRPQPDSFHRLRQAQDLHPQIVQRHHKWLAEMGQRVVIRVAFRRNKMRIQSYLSRR
jgi:hypothetical protein